MDNSKRLYWYCFGFTYIEDGATTISTSYDGFAIKDGITIRAIELARKNAKAKEIAPLTQIIYLGLMTAEEFTRGSSKETTKMTAL